MNVFIIISGGESEMRLQVENRVMSPIHPGGIGRGDNKNSPVNVTQPNTSKMIDEQRLHGQIPPLAIRIA